MKDETYVKEILQKFGETIDCYAQELRDKKKPRTDLRDIIVTQINVSASKDWLSTHPNSRDMPSPDSNPPVLVDGVPLEKGKCHVLFEMENKSPNGVYKVTTGKWNEND